jgi:hypothetical protein
LYKAADQLPDGLKEKVKLDIDHAVALINPIEPTV